MIFVTDKCLRIQIWPTWLLCEPRTQNSYPKASSEAIEAIHVCGPQLGDCPTTGTLAWRLPGPCLVRSREDIRSLWLCVVALPHLLPGRPKRENQCQACLHRHSPCVCPPCPPRGELQEATNSWKPLLYLFPPGSLRNSLLCWMGAVLPLSVSSPL